jgi:hypothetical protein
VDISTDENFNVYKYENMEEKITKSTIPFFEVPKVLIITSDGKENVLSKRLDLDISFVDYNLTKLFRYI